MGTHNDTKTYIPAEEVDAEVHLWDLPYWANPPPVALKEEELIEEAALSFPTVEEVEAIRQEAHSDGFQQGLLEGRKEGHQQGFDKGQAEGLTQGKQQGMTQGYTEGQKQGFEKGLMEAKDKIEREIAALKQVTQQLLEPVNHQQAALEVALASLIEQSVRAVLRVPPHLTQNEIALITQEALAALPMGAKNVTLYLNAQDHALMLEHWGEALPAALVVDDALASGGCRVETDISLIDYSIEERLRQVLAELRLDHFPEQQPLPEAMETVEPKAGDAVLMESAEQSSSEQSPSDLAVEETPDDREVEPLDKSLNETSLNETPDSPLASDDSGADSGSTQSDTAGDSADDP
jgi:flagellar assembly protein FliH